MKRKGKKKRTEKKHLKKLIFCTLLNYIRWEIVLYFFPFLLLLRRNNPLSQYNFRCEQQIFVPSIFILFLSRLFFLLRFVLALWFEVCVCVSVSIRKLSIFLLTVKLFAVHRFKWQNLNRKTFNHKRAFQHWFQTNFRTVFTVSIYLSTNVGNRLNSSLLLGSTTLSPVDFFFI